MTHLERGQSLGVEGIRHCQASGVNQEQGRMCWALLFIVIVNSRFLERPQKQSCRNRLIHRRLTKTKLIGSDKDPESQAGRQSDGYGGWCLELRWGGRDGEDDESGFAKEQCFQFGVKELWRDGKGRGLSELVGWVRYLLQCWREFVPEKRDSYGYGGIEKFE